MSWWSALSGLVGWPAWEMNRKAVCEMSTPAVFSRLPPSEPANGPVVGRAALAAAPMEVHWAAVSGAAQLVYRSTRPGLFDGTLNGTKKLIACGFRIDP